MNKALFLTGVISLCIGFAYGQNDSPKPVVSKPVYFDISPPLREMAKNPNLKTTTAWKDGIVMNHERPGFTEENNQNPEKSITDPAVQDQIGYFPNAGITQNFDGVGMPNGDGWPPDTDGDVGLNHYFQVINCHYAIYSKTGTQLVAPTANNAIFTGLPHASSNDGDAVVLYDSQADRWLFSQFALPNYPLGPFYQQIAISTTGDPTGTYYRWEYSYTDMGDYPKFGVWGDGYYMSTNRFSSGSLNFAGTGIYAFNRTQMLAGNASATQISFTLPSTDPSFGFLPADCDGAFPPAGTPEYFTYIYTSSPYHLRIYEFHADWTTPANSTFGNYTDLTVNSFNTSSGRNVIVQKGVTQKVDAIEDRLMFRMQYRSFSDHKSMVCNHSVNVGSSIAGVRWYELRNTGSGWSIYQQSTYSPADNTSRWMGSVAMDANGDIALGFSKSGSTVYPSVYYTGRLATDALNTMTLTETSIIDGAGSQTGGINRWGDYSAMTIDPTSSNTFWYTQMYYASTGTNYKTRIASFTVGSTGAPLTVTATANPTVCNPGAAVQLSCSASGGSGSYTYSWTSTPAGFTSTSQAPVVYPMVNTTYSVLVSDGSSSGSGSCSVTVNMSATATATPSTINPGGTSQLNAIAQGGSGNYTYSWTSVPAGFTSTVANPVVSPALNTTYNVAVNDGTQTVNASCSVTVSMTVSPTATPSFIDPGSSSQLNANALGGSGNYTYSWTSVPAGFTSTSANPVVYPTVATVYTVLVNDGTQTKTGSCSVGINMVVTATATPPSIEPGGTSQLNAAVQGGSGSYSYSWVSNPAGFTSTQQNPVVSPAVSTTYTVTVNDGTQTKSAYTTVLVNMSVVVTATPSTISPGESSQLNTTVTGGSGAYTYSWASNPAGFSSTNADPVVNPAINTTYTVTVNDGTQNANGSATVYVNLSCGASANPSTICAGQTSQLSANPVGGSGNYTYSWTSTPAGFTSALANPVVSPTVTTTYNLQVNDGSNNANSSAIVNVIPLPVVNAGADTTVCKDIPKVPVNGTASNQNSVIWSTSGDGTFQNPTQLSTYYFPGTTDRTSPSVSLLLTAHPNSPCVTDISDTKVITIDACTGIQTVSANDFGVSVMPNPSQGNFTVTVTGVNSGSIRLTVLDVHGKAVYSGNMESNGTTTGKKVDLTTLSKGMYLVKVEAGGKEKTQRIVIE